MKTKLKLLFGLWNALDESVLKQTRSNSFPNEALPSTWNHDFFEIYLAYWKHTYDLNTHAINVTGYYWDGREFIWFINCCSWGNKLNNSKVRCNNGNYLASNAIFYSACSIDLLHNNVCQTMLSWCIPLWLALGDET